MQVPEILKKCVAFLGDYDEQGNRKFRGTGFFVAVPIDANLWQAFFVTADHVAGKLSRSKYFVRVNTKDGRSDEFVIDPTANPDARWWRHPSEKIDAAVLPWAPPSQCDYKALRLSDLACPETLAEGKYTIDVGDEVYICGLFSRHHGNDRNIPIVRIGNIAMMPEEPILTEDFGEMEAYLIEARSIGGVSGSPAFVLCDHLKTGARDLGLIHAAWTNSRPLEYEGTLLQPRRFGRGRA